MTTKEMIAVMQAFDAGKKIEFRHRIGVAGWIQVDTPIWDWHECEYRVKPSESVEFWCLVESGCKPGFLTREAAEHYKARYKFPVEDYRVAKFREVVEENV